MGRKVDLVCVRSSLSGLARASLLGVGVVRTGVDDTRDRMAAEGRTGFRVASANLDGRPPEIPSENENCLTRCDGRCVDVALANGDA